MDITTVTMAELADILTPGDVITVKNGEHGILNYLITTMQASLLADLNPQMPAEEKFTDIKERAGFTHCMLVNSVDKDQKVTTIIENYYPCCTQRLLSDKIKPGSVIGISRFKWIDTDPETQLVLAAARRDVTQKKPYPIWKLFYYFGWRWGWQKTLLGKPFMQVFKLGMPGKKDDQWQVCSGSVWKWCLAGVLDIDHLSWLNKNDRPAEGWYPARVLADHHYFNQKGVFKIVAHH